MARRFLFLLLTASQCSLYNGLTRHITLLDSCDVNFLILSSVFVLQNWIFSPLYILLCLRCHSWYRTLQSNECHSKAHSVSQYLCDTLCKSGHTDGYICSCTLYSLMFRLSSCSPHGQRNTELTPGSNRRAARCDRRGFTLSWVLR